MTDNLVLKSIESRFEDEISKEIHDDIIGCKCFVLPTDFTAKRLSIIVAQSNSGRLRNVITSDVLSVDMTEHEVVVETKNSTYIFEK